MLRGYLEIFSTLFSLPYFRYDLHLRQKLGNNQGHNAQSSKGLETDSVAERHGPLPVRINVDCIGDRET